MTGTNLTGVNLEFVTDFFEDDANSERDGEPSAPVTVGTSKFSLAVGFMWCS